MRLIPTLMITALPLGAWAEAPQVVTDVAPIQSLVAQVMGDLGTPKVLVSGGASPHDFQFTFDQADAVQSADLVIWAGPALTPWLADSLTTLAPDVDRLTLLETDGWDRLDLRDWDDAHDHDAHGAEDDDTHDDHGAIDPHAWLDPRVAIFWTGLIADSLSAQDPDNASTYAANRDTSIARLTALDAEIAAQMTALSDVVYLVPHDAYQYFEVRYGVPAAGAITLSDAAQPGPARIAELQAVVAAQNVSCVLSDPQTRGAWGDLIRGRTEARTAVADPMGGDTPGGPDFYEAMMRDLAEAYVTCIGG